MRTVYERFILSGNVKQYPRELAPAIPAYLVTMKYKRRKRREKRSPQILIGGGIFGENHREIRS